MSDPLPLQQFDLDCHWLHLCIPAQFFIWGNIGQTIVKNFPETPVYKCFMSLINSLFHVSHPCRRRNLTLPLKILNFASTYISLTFLTRRGWTKAVFSLWIPVFTSYSVSTGLVTTLPKYEDLLTSSISFSFILNFLLIFALNLSDLVVSQSPVISLLSKSINFFSTLRKAQERRHLSSSEILDLQLFWSIPR